MNYYNRGFVFVPSAVTAVSFLALIVVRYARGECWDTGCQPDTWLIKGCEQYDDMTELKREPCGGGKTAAGHVYSCCYQRNSVDPASSRPLCRATDCLSDNSMAVGCSRYDGGDAIEVGRSPCVRGGYSYFCCDNPNPAHEQRLNRTGDLTYYSLGLTACGRVYADSDMVAAVAFDHFTTSNPNFDPMCGRRVKIVDPTTLKHVVVTVKDKCEGCKTNDIDVSPAAFEKLKPKIVGRIKVVWDFI